MTSSAFGTFKVRSRLVWHGERIVNKIVRGAGKGIVAAVELYYKTLTKKLRDAGEGSIPFLSKKGFKGGFGTRLRIKHSSPGQVPLIQTYNLLNSIKKSFSFGRVAFGKRNLLFTGRISSDVGYAKTLERGGTFSARTKKHTSIKLINPLKGRITIAARPVWGPTFAQTRAKMIGLINKEIIKALKA